MLHNGLEVYTNSMLHTFMSCHRKYKERYDNLLVVRGKPNVKMAFGTTIHEGMAAWYKTGDLGLACAAAEQKGSELQLVATMEEDPKYSLQRAREVLVKYEEFYRGKDLQVQYVEMPFVVEVPGKLRDGRPTPPFMFAGTIDGLATMRVHDKDWLYLLEHKTAGQISSTYIRSFSITNQITAYLWALSKYMEQPVVGAVVNIFHILTRETNFIRAYPTRDKWELDAWELELQDIVDDIRLTRENGIFYKNTSQCAVYSMCPYVTLCKTHPDSMSNFVEADYVQEIPGDLNWLFKKEKEELVND